MNLFFYPDGSEIRKFAIEEWLDGRQATPSITKFLTQKYLKLEIEIQVSSISGVSG